MRKKVYGMFFLFILFLLFSCTSTAPFVSDVTTSSDITIGEKLSYYGGKEVFVDEPDMFFDGEVDTESLIISNTRHKQALYRSLENCNLALEKINLNEYLDLISIYITSAMKSLGEITGDELEEDLLNKIFSEFCCGK